MGVPAGVHVVPSRPVAGLSSIRPLSRHVFDDLVSGADRLRRPPGRTILLRAQGANDQSTLANVQFSYELARRLQTASVTATALHPGAVSTAFGAEDPGGVQRRLVPIMRPVMKGTAQSAALDQHARAHRQRDQETNPRRGIFPIVRRPGVYGCNAAGRSRTMNGR